MTWREAPIVLEAGHRARVGFAHPWEAEARGALLRSRAFDDGGLPQPDTVSWNARGYRMDAMYGVPIMVEKIAAGDGGHEGVVHATMTQAPVVTSWKQRA